MDVLTRIMQAAYQAHTLGFFGLSFGGFRCCCLVVFSMAAMKVPAYCIEHQVLQAPGVGFGEQRFGDIEQWA